MIGLRSSKSSGDMLALHPDELHFLLLQCLPLLFLFLIRTLRGVHPSL